MFNLVSTQKVNSIKIDSSSINKEIVKECQKLQAQVENLKNKILGLYGRPVTISELKEFKISSSDEKDTFLSSIKIIASTKASDLDVHSKDEILKTQQVILDCHFEYELLEKCLVDVLNTIKAQKENQQDLKPQVQNIQEDEFADLPPLLDIPDSEME